MLYIHWDSKRSYLWFLLGKLGFNWENRRFQLGNLLFQLGKEEVSIGKMGGFNWENYGFNWENRRFQLGK